ncbi:hypothetical protein HDU96_002834, partial [Phlyctochytrium bullatum]
MFIHTGTPSSPTLAPTSPASRPVLVIPPLFGATAPHAITLPRLLLLFALIAVLGLTSGIAALALASSTVPALSAWSEFYVPPLAPPTTAAEAGVPPLRRAAGWGVFLAAQLVAAVGAMGVVAAVAVAVGQQGGVGGAADGDVPKRK